MVQNGDYGPMVRDMNKCHKTDPPSWGSSPKRAHNIGRLREFFIRNCKNTPKMAQNGDYGRTVRDMNKCHITDPPPPPQ